MTKQELNAATKIALDSGRSLSDHPIEVFDGYGLRGFEKVTCTLKCLAALIRWECVYMFSPNPNLGNRLDQEALNFLASIGRTKFQVVEA